MKGKIILNLAMSIDGYIASENGDYDWILGDGDSSLNTDVGHNYASFLEDIDIVLMGKNCYNQGFSNDFPAKQVFVATSEVKEDESNIHFINNDVLNIIKHEKQKGKNIYLFGGGILIDSFIKNNAIDEYIIGIIPIILGKGKKLFLDNNPNILLHLNKYVIEDGIPLLYYVKRK
ncbi:MAG: dihydrofolate reductase family protein [Bacteroidales bacterium]|nr:dihydrofolate reductase family protein [Bacteroidales bacterium]NCD04987.1 dihydrofolate reductase [Spirochaetia bacterium]